MIDAGSLSMIGRQEREGILLTTVGSFLSLGSPWTAILCFFCLATWAPRVEAPAAPCLATFCLTLAISQPQSTRRQSSDGVSTLAKESREAVSNRWNQSTTRRSNERNPDLDAIASAGSGLLLDHGRRGVTGTDRWIAQIVWQK
jgi:hypothetical protein